MTAGVSQAVFNVRQFMADLGVQGVRFAFLDNRPPDAQGRLCFLVWTPVLRKLEGATDPARREGVMVWMPDKPLAFVRWLDAIGDLSRSIRTVPRMAVHFPGEDEPREFVWKFASVAVRDFLAGKG